MLIREFFQTEDRPVATAELRQLSQDDRRELAAAIAEQKLSQNEDGSYS